MADPAISLGPDRSPVALWNRALAYDRAHPHTADALVALTLAVVTTPYVAVHNTGRPAVWACHAALLLPLLWRRRHPLGVFTVLAAVALVQWLLAEPLVTDVSLLIALFTIAYERPRSEAVAAAAVLELGVVLASVHWRMAGSWDRSLVGLTGLAGMALLAGVALRVRRDHLAELTERAARLEVERDQQAQIAAAAERTRIAREMHDVIAHSLAVIVTMADGAAAKLNRDPVQAGDAITSIGQVGRQALSDTRRLLGVLRDRDHGAELAPLPGLGQLEDLAAQMRATGLAATVSFAGTPFPLAPGTELTVYRLVQEAATNTLKHASGATAIDVLIGFRDPFVDVEVRDNGRPALPVGGGPEAGGHGIAGMRERIDLYGGHVDAGPGPAGGWAVRASFDTTGRHGR